MAGTPKGAVDETDWPLGTSVNNHLSVELGAAGTPSSARSKRGEFPVGDENARGLRTVNLDACIEGQISANPQKVAIHRTSAGRDKVVPCRGTNQIIMITSIRSTTAREVKSSHILPIE